MEQSPVDAGVGVRHAAGEGHSRGLHPRGRGAVSQGAQSRPVCMQSLFRGWSFANLTRSRNVGQLLSCLTYKATQFCSNKQSSCFVLAFKPWQLV